MQEPRAKAPSQNDIETIVRVVMQRLRSMKAAPEALLPAGSAANSSASASAGTLRLERKLITLEDLAGRLGSFKILQVDSRAVVTPAVQDELRGRGIELHRVAPERSETAGVKHPLLVLSSRTRQLSVASQAQAMHAQTLAADDDEVTTAELLDKHLSAGVRANLWCAAKPFAAVRATRRHASVVAVQLSKLDDLRFAVEQANPNTIIVDERDWSAAAVVNLARAWQKKLARSNET